jgi:coenzyme PQQ biosynthesis protein PqqD
MADAHSVPAQRGSFYLEELEGEAVLYSKGGKRAIYLNETATVIWQLCDGQRTVAEIIGLLAAEYPEAAATIEADVIATVDRLVGERALVVGATPDGQAPAAR